MAISEVDEVNAQEVVYLKPRKRSRFRLLLVSALRTFWTSRTARPVKDTVIDADFAPTEEPEEETQQEEYANDEELNRIVGMFKLARNAGYTLRLIPGTPEENAPVFDRETETIIRPAA